MPDDELTSLIRERQRRAECEAAGIAFVPDELSARKPPHCDTPIPAVPDTLYAPNQETIPDPSDRKLPAPLVVWSPEVEVACTTGSGSLTVTARESSSELYLDDVPELTRSELYRVAPNQAALQVALDDNLEDLISGAITEAQFDAALRAASTAEASAVAGIREAAVILREDLRALVTVTALSRLVCNFANEEVWAVCDSSQPDGYSVFWGVQEPAPVGNYQRVAAAHPDYNSTSSQVEANALALLGALSALDCVYLSAEVVRTCADSNADFDYSYADNGGPFMVSGTPYNTLADLDGFSAPSVDSLRAVNTLIYSVTKPAGFAVSAISQADADEIAALAALSELDCFFPSREVATDCAAVSAAVQAEIDGPPAKTKEVVFAEMDSDYGLDPASVTNIGLVPDGIGKALDSTEGLIVALPAGMYVSRVGQGDADSEAAAFAAAHLACVWYSPEVTCGCTDYQSDVTHPDYPGVTSFAYAIKPLLDGGDNYELLDYPAHLDPLRSSGAVTFAKGAFGTSSAEPFSYADAMSYCKASLTCTYCNSLVAPRCTVAYDYNNPQSAEPPAGGPAVDLYTEGTTPLPLTLVQDPNVVYYGVSTTISSGMAADVVCDSNPATVQAFAESNAAIPPLVNDLAAEPVCRFTNAAVTVTCADKVGALSYALAAAVAARSITIPAGTFDAVNQWDADQIAATFARASLTCEYGNAALEIFCGGGAPSAPVAADYAPGAKITLGAAIAALDAESVGKVALVAAAHTFFSLESPTAATQLAYLTTASQLDCFYTNDAVTYSTCPGVEILITSGSVPARLFRSTVDKPSAQLPADALAVTLTVCEDPTAELDLPIPIASPFGVVIIKGGSPSIGGSPSALCTRVQMIPGAATKRTRLSGMYSGTPPALDSGFLDGAIALGLHRCIALPSTAHVGVVWMAAAVEPNPDTSDTANPFVLTTGSAEFGYTVYPSADYTLGPGTVAGTYQLTRVIAEVTRSGETDDDVAVVQCIHDAQKIGTTITAAGPRPIIVDEQSPSGSAAASGPLQLVGGTGPTKLQVTSGLVNGQVPKLSGTFLDAGTPPELTVVDNVWVWLKVVGTFATPDTHVITVEQTGTSAPHTESAITATTFTTCLLVGSATFAGGVVTGIETRAAGHLGVDSFGAVNLWWGV